MPLAVVAVRPWLGAVGPGVAVIRGVAHVHPTVAELRVGYLPVTLPHPITEEPVEIGEILITECEIIAMYEETDSTNEASPGSNHQAGAGIHNNNIETLPTFTLGYGACFGHNEVKAISMAILDRSLQKGMKDGPANPSEDQEFVLLHVLHFSRILHTQLDSNRFLHLL